MNALKIIQLCAGLAAITALVSADALGVSLSEMSVGMLAFVAGWVTKRPSELLPIRSE